MKCPECDGYKNFVSMAGTPFEVVRPCERCNGTGEIEITNDEWRKTCSVEEFAKWISNLAYACMRCGMSNGEAYCHIGYCIQDEEDALLWLKQPHKE